ncbi:hypothetical protein FOZ61_002116 [Perkinsus olseni]|uniref:Uncharacterized protein n=1 Tax=Perkinsus olseni TaxID=32597 RepID=A0A7J6LV46_PEROL|nr:hypothetical protein FOZ61_002116 [Perkinsus olseni]
MSSIDVMGVTKDIAPAAHKFILTNALAGSDHLPLQLTLGVIPHFTKQSCRSAKRRTWNFKTVDWTAFRSVLDSHIASIDWSSSVHVIHSQISSAFAAAASHFIHRGRLHLYKPFWTPSLNKLRLEKNAVRRALYRRAAAFLPHSILQDYTVLYQ